MLRSKKSMQWSSITSLEDGLPSIYLFHAEPAPWNHRGPGRVLEFGTHSEFREFLSTLNGIMDSRKRECTSLIAGMLGFK